MWPDRVSNPGPLTYESGALLTALRGPAPKIQRTLTLTAPTAIRPWETFTFTFYQSINFHLIPFYTFRDILEQLEWLSRDNLSIPPFALVTYKHLQNLFTHLSDRS